MYYFVLSFATWNPVISGSWGVVQATSNPSDPTRRVNLFKYKKPDFWNLLTLLYIRMYFTMPYICMFFFYLSLCVRSKWKSARWAPISPRWYSNIKPIIKELYPINYSKFSSINAKGWINLKSSGGRSVRSTCCFTHDSAVTFSFNSEILIDLNGAFESYLPVFRIFHL